MKVDNFSDKLALSAGRRLVIGLVLMVWTVCFAGVCTAADDEYSAEDFFTVEQRLFGSEDPFGAPVFLAGGQIGGTRNNPDVPSEPMHLGEKFKAGLLSLVLPGAGQYYNHQNTKAGFFGVAELGIWGAYAVFGYQGNNRTDSYEQYAGIYAGTSGQHSDSYWQSVGRYLSSDEYNEAVLREERAYDEAEHDLISGGDAWQWRNEDFQDRYRLLRADANTAYDHRDFMLMFAVINRALSVIDAVRNAGKDNLATNVLGMNMAVEVSPSLVNPTTQLVFSRKF